MEPGDWVEGEPKWWWKYVFPVRDRFWAQFIASRFEPSPVPWVQSVSAEVLEGVAMIRASATVTDKKVSRRLSEEGVKKIAEATKLVQHAQAA
jgi:hypothetical protein